jgi:leader peptidase (prepilin peptidase)/N-methyltransferase
LLRYYHTGSLPRPSATPAVGLAAAALGAACFVRFGFSARGFISAFFAATLVVLSAIDIEQRLLPDRIVLPSTAVVLAAQLAFYPEHAVEWIAAAFGAAGFLFLAALVYRGGLGMGDVKLALLLGAALGKLVFAGLVFGFLAAALAGVILIAREGLSARKKTIPLGPFLAFGAIIALFLGNW